MSTTFFFVEDSESEGLIKKAVPEEADQESLRGLSLLHIPNDLRDSHKLLDLVLKSDIYNFTISMQDKNELSEDFTSLPDMKILSDWLIALSKQRDQKHTEPKPPIKVFLVAIDRFNDEKITPDTKPEEHKKHQKIQPAWWPWCANTSKLSSEDARYSDKTDDPEFRWNYSKWHYSLMQLLEEGGGKEIKINFGEMPLACGCEGIQQALHNRVRNIDNYEESGGREPAVEFQYNYNKMKKL